MRVEAYRIMTKGCWSVRRHGRVIAHESRVVLRSCTMSVREGGRRRAIREGQRNVHAWVDAISRMSSTASWSRSGITLSWERPSRAGRAFISIHVANLVLLYADDGACAAL